MTLALLTFCIQSEYSWNCQSSCGVCACWWVPSLYETEVCVWQVTDVRYCKPNLLSTAEDFGVKMWCNVDAYLIACAMLQCCFAVATRAVVCCRQEWSVTVPIPCTWFLRRVSTDWWVWCKHIVFFVRRTLCLCNCMWV